MHRHTISKDKEKKEGQRHHEESRFSRLSILSLFVLSMVSSLTLSRMSIISLPFSFRGIEGSKAITSSVVFKSSSPKSLSSSTPSRASPRSASPSSGTSPPWCYKQKKISNWICPKFGILDYKGILVTCCFGIFCFYIYPILLTSTTTSTTFSTFLRAVVFHPSFPSLSPVCTCFLWMVVLLTVRMWITTPIFTTS